MSYEPFIEQFEAYGAKLDQERRMKDIAYCSDCKKNVKTYDDPCPIHKDCEDVAKRCSECDSLNVCEEIKC